MPWKYFELTSPS